MDGDEINRDLLAIPNCSEGTDPDRIDRLVRSCRVPGIRILNVHSDSDHDRTVITLTGSASALIHAGVSLARASRDAIDLREQHGVHPRVGALDVLPFVAMVDAQMPLAVDAARTAAARIAAEVHIPCFLYGAAATRPNRERPAHLRAGGLAALTKRMKTGETTPDYEPPKTPGTDPPRGQTPPGDRPPLGTDPSLRKSCSDPGAPPMGTDPPWGQTPTGVCPHVSAGVVLVGARGPLIAWNMWLADGDVDDARAIAAAVREGGSGGGLVGVRALGLQCDSTGLAQVSMNIEDYRRTSVGEVVARVRSEAALRGRTIGASELVGLLPRDGLAGTSPQALGLMGLEPDQIISED